MDTGSDALSTVLKAERSNAAHLVPLAAEIRAELRARNAALAEFLGTPRPPHETDLALVRRIRAEGGAGFPPPVRDASGREMTFPAAAGPLAARRFDVVAPAGALLYVHGGGWNTGAVDQQDALLRATATAANVTVVAVDHRLAPEHPHPAPGDDIVAAVAWFEEWAPTVLGVDRLVLAGDSTGAHLALSALLQHAAARPPAGSPWVGLDLSVGIYDLGLTASARSWGDRNLLLSTPILEWIVELFTPGLDADARRHPTISPLYADLSPLPPTLLTAAARDPLVDDSVLLHRRMLDAGVDARLDVYPDANHGFFLADSAAAAIAVDRRAAFLRHVTEGS